MTDLPNEGPDGPDGPQEPEGPGSSQQPGGGSGQPGGPGSSQQPGGGSGQPGGPGGSQQPGGSGQPGGPRRPLGPGEGRLPDAAVAADGRSITLPTWFLATTAAVVALFLAFIIFVVATDDDGSTDVDAGGTTTSEEEPVSDSTTTTVVVVAPTSTGAEPTTTTSTTTTTTVAPTTTTSTTTTTTTVASTTTTTEPAEIFASAVWPWLNSSTRYTDPREAARGFAVDFVGFEDPVIGEFRQGDTRSGEVEIRSMPDGPITTVFVRQLGAASTWWVLGSATENLVLNEPVALGTVRDPLRVRGSAIAFEGNVNVLLRRDDRPAPLVDGFVTAGGDALAPFEGEFDWTNPGGGSGAVVLLTMSAEDGSVLEASVTRVVFAAAG